MEGFIELLGSLCFWFLSTARVPESKAIPDPNETETERARDKHNDILIRLFVCDLLGQRLAAGELCVCGPLLEPPSESVLVAELILVLVLI